MRPLPSDAWPKATRADWRAQVQVDLEGAEPETLDSTLDDGVVFPALCDSLPNARSDSARLPAQPPVRTALASSSDLQRTTASDAVGAALGGGFDLLRMTHAATAASLASGEGGGLQSLEPERLALSVSIDRGGVDILVTLERLGLGHAVVPAVAETLDDLPPSLELAYTLCAVTELVRGAGHAQPPRAEATLRRLFVPVVLGTDLLTQLAKLRAARWLWRDLTAAFLGRPLPARLWAHASAARLCAIDPHTNLVRTSLQAFAALASNCEVFEPAPFDAAVPAEARHLALNQVHLLRHESALDQVRDPAAGSFAIETLTADIAARAWTKFQAVEARGGLARVGDEIDSLLGLDAARRARAERLARGEEVIVGVNRFADPRAALSAAPGVRQPEPLAALEALRRRAAQRPMRSALLLPFGDAAARRAGAEFAAEFLRLAGIEVIDTPGFRDVDGMVAAVRQHRPALAILCGDAAASADLVRGTLAAIRAQAPNTLLYATGRAPAGSEQWGAIGFLHQGLDRIGTLSGILDRLDAS